MRRLGWRVALLVSVLVVVMAVVAARSGDESPGPEATARAWVEAVNAKDWPRACALTVGDEAACVRTASERLPDSDGDMRFEGLERSGESIDLDVSPFPLTAANKRQLGRQLDSGWTAYAPLPIHVERQSGGGYRIRFEPLDVTGSW